VNQYDKARYVTFEFGNKAKGYMVEKNCNWFQLFILRS
jgi:hypothetical protein